jgi:predicted  nucleic acid-binding Zn-ribbon protein
MAGPAAILRDIHRLRTHAAALQARIEQAPRQLKIQHKVVANLEDSLHQAHDAIKILKVHIHEKEVSVKSTHEHIKRYEQQLNDITSKKEYDALKAEIAAARERISQLEDEALTLMLEVEERTAQLPGMEGNLKKAKGEMETFERDYAPRLEDWKKEHDEVHKQIVAAEDSLPQDIRPQYDRLVRQFGADALAAVEDASCTACHTAITAQTYHNVKLQQFVFCRSCARLLYWKDAG